MSVIGHDKQPMQSHCIIQLSMLTIIDSRSTVSIGWLVRHDACGLATEYSIDINMHPSYCVCPINIGYVYNTLMFASLFELIMLLNLLQSHATSSGHIKRFAL